MHYKIEFGGYNNEVNNFRLDLSFVDGSELFWWQKSVRTFVTFCFLGKTFVTV